MLTKCTWQVNLLSSFFFFFFFVAVAVVVVVVFFLHFIAVNVTQGKRWVKQLACTQNTLYLESICWSLHFSLSINDFIRVHSTTRKQILFFLSHFISSYDTCCAMILFASFCSSMLMWWQNKVFQVFIHFYFFFSLSLDSLHDFEWVNSSKVTTMSHVQCTHFYFHLKSDLASFVKFTNLHAKNRSLFFLLFFSWPFSLSGVFSCICVCMQTNTVDSLTYI